MAELWRRKSVRGLGVVGPGLLVSTLLSGCLGWSTQFSTTDGSSLAGISCPSANVCVAVGAAASGDAIVTRTSDAGGQWASDTNGVAGPGLRAVSCADPEHCVAVGAQGSVLVSTDGGASWTASTGVPVNRSLAAVSCPDAGHCWATTTQPSGGMQGESLVVTTADGGTSWTNLSWSPPAFSDGDFLYSASLNDITCTTTSDCVAVGLATFYGIPLAPALPNYEQQGVVAATIDGGRTWNTQLGPVMQTGRWFPSKAPWSL